MTTANEVLKAAQALGLELIADGEHLRIKAPAGVMTMNLKRDLKAHKADILYLLELPEPAKPGAELEQLRREIGDLARERAQKVGA